MEQLLLLSIKIILAKLEKIRATSKRVFDGKNLFTVWNIATQQTVYTKLTKENLDLPQSNILMNTKCFMLTERGCAFVKFTFFLNAFQITCNFMSHHRNHAYLGSELWVGMTLSLLIELRLN